MRIAADAAACVATAIKTGYKNCNKCWTTSLTLITFSTLSYNAMVYNVEVIMYSWGALFTS